MKKLLYTEAPHFILLSRLPDSQIFAYFLLLTDLCNGITENKLPAHSGRNRSGLSPDFLSQFHKRNCSLNILLFNYKQILSLFCRHFNGMLYFYSDDTILFTIHIGISIFVVRSSKVTAPFLINAPKSPAFFHHTAKFAISYFNFSRDINRKLISKSPQDIQII